MSKLQRAALAALACLACYQFDWNAVRRITLLCNVALGQTLGVDIHRTSAVTVLQSGVTYEYGIGCAMADVWCLSLPLLWDCGRTVPVNLRRILLYTLGLFSFNILRLTFSDLMSAHGAPWDLAHYAVTGASYFATLLWLNHHRPL